MKRSPPLSLTLFVLILALAGCDKGGDARLRKIATGTWARGKDGVLILAPNGTSSARWTNWDTTPPAAWAYQGTWSIRDAVLTFAATNVQIWNTTNRTPTTVERYKIIQADDLNMIYSNGTQTTTLTRIK